MTMRRQHLTRITERWQTAGLPPGPALELLESTAAAEAAVRTAHKAAIAHAEATVQAAAAKVAADPAGFADLADQVAHAHTLTDPARSLMARAVATIYANAAGRLADLWATTDPALIAAHDEMMAEMAKVAPKVAGIADDQAAVRAGAGTATAWAKANELTERRAALIALRSEVADVLDLPGYHRDDDTRQYRRPENLRAWAPRSPDAPHHQVTRLIDDIDAGAEPALCTDAEVAATLERTGGDRHPAKVHPFAADRVRSAELLASIDRASGPSW